MYDTLSTTTEILERLKEPTNDPIWREFEARYRPVLVAVARKMGVSATDAEDIAQEALLRFVRNFREGGYDRTRGRLRDWMIGIARNCIREAQRKAGVRRERHGLSAVDLPATDIDIDAIWDAECAAAIFERALHELKTRTRLSDRTIRAFTLLVVDQYAPEQVAEELGMTLDSVYAAKHRCATALRKIKRRLENAYEIR